MIIAQTKPDAEVIADGGEIARIIATTTIEQQRRLWLSVIVHLESHQKHHTAKVLRHVLDAL